MLSEKKIWLCEQYAQKMWTLSLALAQEAARTGHFGRGYAVVAEEARTLANKLFEYTEKVKFDGGADDFKGITDFAVMMGFLATNTMLEVLRVNPVIHDMTNKSMAVLAEELRKMAIEINALAEKKAWDNTFVLPEIASPLKSTHTLDYFFHFSIGGVSLVENTANIMEFCYLRKDSVNGDTVDIRTMMMMPNINCYRRFDLQCSSVDPNMQTVMIVRPEGTSVFGKVDGLYAVLIDDLGVSTVFSSNIGYAVPPKTDSVFSPYARECWDAVGGDQLMFIDWQKLAEK